MTFQTIQAGISFIANITEITVGVAAIIVAITQRKKISAALAVLLSYSLQASLADLRHWIETLHESSQDDKDKSKKFRSALAHILGKIKGNPTLSKHFGDNMMKRVRVMMTDIDEGKQVNETDKISLYSEIKESITTLEVENHNSKGK